MLLGVENVQPEYNQTLNLTKHVGQQKGIMNVLVMVASSQVVQKMCGLENGER